MFLSEYDSIKLSNSLIEFYKKKIGKILNHSNGIHCISDENDVNLLLKGLTLSLSCNSILVFGK